MSTFSGFSEEDIKRLQNGNNILNKSDRAGIVSPTNANVKVKKASLRVQPKHAKKVEIKSLTVMEVPTETRLFTPSESVKSSESNCKNVEDDQAKVLEANKIKYFEYKKQDINKNEEKVTNELNSNKSVEDISEAIDTSTENALSADSQATSHELLFIKQKFKDLEEFQARQKVIEEQNKRRKELLTKALEDRTKQTREEAERLKEIQNEFKKLDAILSNDVKILRHQIELASLDYMEAQKRYQKIEREFLDAKLNLHQKLDRKEMLTEHLCTIIEENEERKAKKLTELLNKLQVTDAPDKIVNQLVEEHSQNGDATSPDSKAKS